MGCFHTAEAWLLFLDLTGWDHFQFYVIIQLGQEIGTYCRLVLTLARPQRRIQSPPYPGSQLASPQRRRTSCQVKSSWDQVSSFNMVFTTSTWKHTGSVNVSSTCLQQTRVQSCKKYYINNRVNVTPRCTLAQFWNTSSHLAHTFIWQLLSLSPLVLPVTLFSMTVNITAERRLKPGNKRQSQCKKRLRCGKLTRKRLPCWTLLE